MINGLERTSRPLLPVTQKGSKAIEAGASRIQKLRFAVRNDLTRTNSALNRI
jgi:hypothetical protein